MSRDFVYTQELYNYCYKVVMAHLSDFDTYVNC